jgi:hypothetical protein
MESISVKHEGVLGTRILILGCPLKEKHSVADVVRKVSGPSFAGCASCEFQRGKDFEFRGDETGEFPFIVHPDRLQCGYSDGVED